MALPCQPRRIPLVALIQTPKSRRAAERTLHLVYASITVILVAIGSALGGRNPDGFADH